MPKINRQEYTDLSVLLEELCGIFVPREKSYLFENRLNMLMDELKCESFNQFLKAIERQKTTLLPRLIELMTTNETSWFRDQSLWDCLEKNILPVHLEELSTCKRLFLRYLCAGVSTGQEAYSLSILIHELAKRMGLSAHLPKIQILGIDVDTTALSKAREGIYKLDSIKTNLQPLQVDTYFDKGPEGSWKIKTKFRRGVEFRTFNLMESLSELGTFDMILCRNVIIYFRERHKRSLVKKLCDQLVGNGLYISGASEAVDRYTTDLDQVQVGEIFYYQLKPT